MRNAMNCRRSSRCRRCRRFFAPLLVCTALLAAGLPISARATDADSGDVALAERLAETARLTLSARHIEPAHWKLAAMLLEAAVKLNPAEPRYSRLWVDAALQAGDNDAALKGLKAYLAVEPDDKPALIQYADLFAASFQTIDKRLEYLRDRVDVALPDEVRSHIAFLAWQAYVERAQMPQAKNMLDTALKLNPLSLEALRARYDQLHTGGTAYERMATLLAILRANPAQFEYLRLSAETLAEVGLAQQALLLYNVGLNVAQRQGRGIQRDYALEYASELLLLNQFPTAKQLVDYAVTINPMDYDAIALRLLIERGTDQKDAAAKSTAQLEGILYNRLQALRQELGDKAATTRPIDAPGPLDWGPLGEDVKKIEELKGDRAEGLRGEYAATLAELAWVETYFRAAPADAKPILEALKKLAPEDSPSVARLEGWAFLLRGEKDPAKVKLSAVKDRDVLAELGLIRLMDARESQKEAEKLLARHPTGLLAVTILDGLRERNVALTPNPEVSGPLAEAFEKFPKDWFNILDQPQVFYSVRAEPLHIDHRFGEPMLVRVTLTNLSEFPVTLGPDGVIHPDLWFDVQFRGVVQQGIPGAGYDRIGHELILKPRGSVSQLVRLDQGPVAQVLVSSPFPPMQLMFQVRTNPTANGVAAAGQMVQGSKFLGRQGFALSQQALASLSQALQQGGPAEKIRSTDLGASVAVVLSQQKDNDEARRVALQLLELIKGELRDSSSAVQAWAGGTLTRISPPNDRAAAVSRLVNDPYWVSRMLGLAFMGPMKLDEQRTLARQVAQHETDPLVLGFSKAMVELLDQAIAASTQAASQPTTAPSPNPLLPPAQTTQPSTAPGASPFTQFPSTRPAGPPLVIPSDIPLTLPPSTPPSTPRP